MGHQSSCVLNSWAFVVLCGVLAAHAGPAAAQSEISAADQEQVHSSNTAADLEVPRSMRSQPASRPSSFSTLEHYVPLAVDLEVPRSMRSQPAGRPSSLSTLEHYVPLPVFRPPAPRPDFFAEVVEASSEEALAGARRNLGVPFSTREIIANAGVSGITGAILFDLVSGTVIDAHARHISLPPASTIKVATGVWALDVLGPQYRFETRILATGPVADGRLRGDLVLQGGGDPTLDSLALDALADAILRYGIQDVEGRFLFDDTALPRGSWIDPAQRDGMASSTGFGGLNLNFNRILLEADPQESGVFNTRLTAEADQLSVPVSHIKVQVVNRASDDTSGLLRHRDTDRGEIWEIDSETLRETPVRWLPVRDTGLYAASVFRTLAQRRGLTLSPPERISGPAAAGTVVALHRGRPLAEIVSGMLEFSNNLTAEILGLTAANAAGEEPAEGLTPGARRMAAWIGPDFALYNRLIDHSGLSDRARTTPAAFQELLTRSVAPPDSSNPDIRSLLPVRNLEDAGDRNPLPPVMVQAKTGTLYFVRGLVGYIRLGNGSARDLGFAIFSADLRRRRAMEVNHFAPAPPPDVEQARRWRMKAVELESAILRNWIEALS